MLNSLSKQIRDCYERAAEADRRAEQQTDAALKKDFLDCARRWRKLARSYEFTEQLKRFTYKPTKEDQRKS